MSDSSFASLHPRKNLDAPFLVLGGFADFILPATYVNGHGAIIGLANVAPVSVATISIYFNALNSQSLIYHPHQHATKKLYELSQKSLKDSSVLPEAQRLQGIIARGDFTIAKTSIAGTKYLLQKLYGYGGLPRKPLPPIEATDAEALWAHPHTQELIKLEKESGGKVIGK